MTPEKTRALRLAAAVEAFSEGPGVVLARELVAYLEDDSIAVVSARAAAAPTDDRDELLAEIERLRDELARAKDAARKRKTRRVGASSPRPASSPTDPRQEELFHRSPVEKRPDVLTGRSDASSLSLSDLDLKSDQKRSESGRPHRPDAIDEPVAHDPEAPPREVLDIAERERPDLPEVVVRHSWKRFARVHRSHDCFAAAVAHWTNWIANEDRAKAEKRIYTAYTAAQQRVEPPPSAPASGVELADEDDDLVVAEAAPAPPSAVHALGVRLGLPPLARAFGTPQEAMEALERIERDPPEPRAMSA